MPGGSARHAYVRAAALVVLAVFARAWSGRPPAMPPFTTFGTQPVYAPGDAPALVWLEPVLHAAWLGTPSTLAAGGVGLVAFLGAGSVAVSAGASLPAAACVLAALALDASFGAAVAHASGMAASVGLVWLAASAAFTDRVVARIHRPWLLPLVSLIIWSAAVWSCWMAIVMWPVVLVALRRFPERAVRGVWTAASVAMAVGAIFLHFARVAGEARALLPDASRGVPGWRDAWWVAFDARPHIPSGSFAAPELTDRMGLLLLALAAVGLAAAPLQPGQRRTVVLCAVLTGAAIAVAPVWAPELLRYAQWALMPLAAVGLTWVAAQGRRPSIVSAAIGLTAVWEAAAMGARPPEGRDARVFRDRLVAQLAARVERAPVVFVAEDTRFDSALVAWMAGRPHTWRVAQDREAVIRARDQGHLIVAGAAGRARLELQGMAFAEAFAMADPVPLVMSELEDVFRCATVRGDRWSLLPGVEYTGRLGIEVPPRPGGEMQLVVGDVLDLQLRATTPDGRPLPFSAEPFMSGPGAAAPPADYWLDGGRSSSGRHWIRRVRLPADPLRPALVSLSLSRRSPRVLARLSGYDDQTTASVCAAPVGPVWLRDRAQTGVAIPLDAEEVFGAGWYGLEGGRDAPFRWADHDAVVLLRAAAREEVEVALDAAPAVDPGLAGEPTLTLRVNGVEAGTAVMRTGQARYTWRVPAGVWIAGTNELWWHASRVVWPADRGEADTRRLAVRVAGIHVTRR